MRHKQSASARAIYFLLCFQRCWCTRPQIQRVFYVRKLLVCSIPFQWVIELGSSKIGRTQNRQGDGLFNAIVLCCFKSYSEPTSPWDTEEYATAGAQTSQSKSLDQPSVTWTIHLLLTNTASQPASPCMTFSESAASQDERSGKNGNVQG